MACKRGAAPPASGQGGCQITRFPDMTFLEGFMSDQLVEQIAYTSWFVCFSL
jgi:hypothetical protein